MALREKNDCDQIFFFKNGENIANALGMLIQILLREENKLKRGHTIYNIVHIFFHGHHPIGPILNKIVYASASSSILGAR